MFVIAFSLLAGGSLPAVAATQTDIVGPAGSVAFGTRVIVLPNGNIVVTDPNYSIPAGAPYVGAVYLYNGATGALISTLTGTNANDQVGSAGVTVLSNGNYVVNSPAWGAVNEGAETWNNSATGINGVVSSGNSLVGSTTDDSVGNFGVTVLNNGNYVVRSAYWGAADEGAVTWGNGDVGISGVVSSTNSLVGSLTNDNVGNSGVLPLTNGNYVVISPNWEAANVGAVTWGNGMAGITGPISAGNSLVGSTSGDQVGNYGVTPLSNGNYVVRSPVWGAADEGAATWGNGATGTIGFVSSSNSLVGSTANDSVGSDVTGLTNGNYVVCSSIWSAANVGAATWGNGTAGITGPISAGNSLVGSSADDRVGSFGVRALTNGNYVVRSANWGPGNKGAATWGNGSTGVIGFVSSVNSLVGSSTNDQVSSTDVMALSNGNYVVNSSTWDTANVGAVTWGDGTTGITGPISAGNSLVGSTAEDRVGSPFVITLSNGNYVVISNAWGAGNEGAATWGNGASGVIGFVSSSNSLVGSSSNDQVGNGGATALTNGNYVVRSQTWGTADVGAATWGNGATGTTGFVSSSNSLVGSTADDRVSSQGVTALSNGNYVVNSPNWDTANVGAVTWGDGNVGITGAISASNSLLGITANDQVALLHVTALSNGNYAAWSPEWDGAAVDSGAITLGAGNAGSIVGSITAANSVRGTAASGGYNLGFAYDTVNEQLVVGRRNDNIVSLFRPTYTAIADGNWSGGATWNYGAFTKPADVAIPNGRTVTLDTIATVNSLSVACTGGLTGGSASAYVVGDVTKDYCSAGVFTYPVGTTANGNEYSPVDVNVTSLVTNPSSLTIKATYGTAPASPALSDENTLDRYWTLTETGDLKADLTFNYLQTDVDGNEEAYRILRITGSTAAKWPNSTPDTINNKATATGVSAFSVWTLSVPVAPTAADSRISGRITDADGAGVAGAIVNITGTQTRKTITDANGFYSFANVETSGFYTVTPTRLGYSFGPTSLSFSQLGNSTEAAFVGTPNGGVGGNVINTPEYFVRQHYLDFLGREPDEAGFNFWSDQILSCGSDFNCVERRTINVSAAYFLSIEFQETGGLVDGLYRASFARAPLFSEFGPDTAAVAKDVVVGNADWRDKLTTNKQEFVEAWATRPAFRAAFDNLSNASYVDTLVSNTRVEFPSAERASLVAGLDAGTLTRAAVLQRVAQNEGFVKAKFNEAFVRMQYFGYLRRDPDQQGFDFWLRKLNDFGGNFEQAEMVKAFISSTEYRARFVR